MKLSAKDNNGKDVDWFFMYKISGKAKTRDGNKIPKLTGAEYLYFDSSEGDKAKLVEAPTC